MGDAKADGRKERPIRRFQFNRRNHPSVVVEGIRVDMAGGRVTVVDTQGQPVVEFDEAELSSWWCVSDRGQ